jgi:hypothetical protein
MDQKTLFSTVAAVLLLFAGLVYSIQAESIIGVDGESGSYSNRLSQDSFDRESCERDCQERYGVEPYRRGINRQRNDYYVYARCIQDCNTRFWKEYDRNMRELEKKKR